MGQLKIYARAATLAQHQSAISDALHEALVSALSYPADKKFQRFFPLADGDFVYPADRGENYLVLEVVLFPGRTAQAKKAFGRRVLENLAPLGFTPQAIEIVLIESARENWTIRGVPGDELALNYRVDV